MARIHALSEPALARRGIVEHLGEYDRDGAIAAACRDICTLLKPDDYHQISTRFWQHYLSLPATQHIRHLFTGERLERALRLSEIQRAVGRGLGTARYQPRREIRTERRAAAHASGGAGAIA
jgi:hypothetical protein